MSVTDREQNLVEVYARFLPELIIENVFDGKLADKADLEQFNCAVMFADISGFTPLAESFAAEGAVGAEKLTATLNDYFSHLVGLIQAHGGDVVKFAGDAVLAIWRDGADQRDMAFASWRAAQCGLAIQAALQDYRAGNVHLSLRVAIGAGPVNIVHVGGVFGRWEFLVAGKPLEQVGAVSEEIAPGTVGVSSEVWQLLGEHTDARPIGELVTGDIQNLKALAELGKRRNRPELGLEDHQAPLLRSYLPAAVSHRLDAGHGDYIGELRRLTILFVNLPDIDYQTPVTRAQEIMIALQESCYRYEGSINKLSVDDKGVSLLAALGLPPLAHEDDPDRGIKAAIELNKRLKSLGIRCSVGVSTGRVYCGVVGSPLRREYTIMGDSVNLAARLMQNADDGVLCDEATFLRASKDVQFAEPRSIKLKGKVAPEKVYPPQGVSKKGRTDSQGPMIGREQERSTLAEKLERLLEAHQSSVVILEAEAGYGKSRLTQDFLQSLEGKPLALYQAAADAIESTTPHFSIRELLKDVLGTEASSSPEVLRRSLENLLPEPELIDLMPLLNSIIPLDLKETAYTLQIEGEARATQTTRLIIEIVKRRRPGTPLVIVLEDTHWLDSASWGIVAGLAREVSQLMLMLVTRPVSNPPREMTQLLASEITQLIRMDRMSEADITRLVCARLHVDAMPPTIVRLILDRTEGHPYFSEEMAYALRDSGIIRINGRLCEVSKDVDSALAGVDIPESIEGIITSRIDRLSPEQALTIKVASVIGRSFSLNRVQRLYPVGRAIEQLEEDLNECGRLHLTPLDAAGDDPSYIFKHMITREVSHGLLLNDQSKSLHAKLAEQYEGEGGNPDSLLAHHWELAERPEKALYYLERAVKQAIDEFSNRDAILLSERGIRLIDRYGGSNYSRGFLLRCQGQALFDLGQLNDAERILKAAGKALGAPLPTGKPAMLVGLLREIFRQYRFASTGVMRAPQNDDQPQAEPQAEPQTEPQKTETQRKLAEASSAYNQVQLIYYYQSKNLDMVFSAVRGANLGCLAGKPESALIRTNANLGVVSGLIPIRKLANFYLDLAQAQADALGHPPTTAWVDTVKATYKNGLGLWQESEAHFNAAIATATANGDESVKATMTTARSKMYVMAGRFQDALDGFVSMREPAMIRNDPQAICWSVLGQARCYYRLGRLAEIEPFLEEAKPLLPTLPYNQSMEYLSLCALKRLEDERFDDAIEAIDDCIELLARPSQVMMIFACTQLATAVLKARQIDPSLDIRSRWKRVIRFLKTYAEIFPIGEPVYRFQLGQFEALSGRREAAIRHWRAALESSIRIDVPYIVVASCEALQRSGVDTVAHDDDLQRAASKMVVDSII